MAMSVSTAPVTDMNSPPAVRVLQRPARRELAGAAGVQRLGAEGAQMLAATITTSPTPNAIREARPIIDDILDIPLAHPTRAVTEDRRVLAVPAAPVRGHQPEAADERRS